MRWLRNNIVWLSSFCWFSQGLLIFFFFTVFDIFQNELINNIFKLAYFIVVFLLLYFRKNKWMIVFWAAIVLIYSVILFICSFIFFFILGIEWLFLLLMFPVSSIILSIRLMIITLKNNDNKHKKEQGLDESETY